MIVKNSVRSNKEKGNVLPFVFIVVVSILLSSCFSKQKPPDIAELDAKLTGTWTTADNIKAACSTNLSLFIRRSDGTLEMTGDRGEIFDRATWKIEKIYDSNLAGMRIEHVGRAPIFWIVQFKGDDLKTSIMLFSLPSDVDEAKTDLAKQDPNTPGSDLPLLHKCL